MELWVFDRSDPCSLGPFDIHKEPERFKTRVIRFPSQRHAVEIAWLLEGFKRPLINSTSLVFIS
jgi:Fungal protein kinase